MTDTEDEFDPTKMESVLIAPPLVAMMDALDQQHAARETKGEDQLLPVLINLNYRFPGGLSAARDSLIELLSSWGVESGAASGERVQMRKTKLSLQYVFAVLDRHTIRRLADEMIDETDEQRVLDDQLDKEENYTPLKRREVFMIWPDFKLESHVNRTVATIKADAARNSFGAEGTGIVWAVLDSGICQDHAHFKRHGNLNLADQDAALRHMDFTRDWPDIRDLDAAARAQAIADETQAALTDDYGHGSHVAGVIAGEYVTDAQNGFTGRGRAPEKNVAYSTEAFVYHKKREKQENQGFTVKRLPRLSGMAPRAKLVSFKVLDQNGRGEASNIIAALAQIHKINEYGRDLRIHGVNLSVGYPFDPEWFACGHSPLCVEVDRLVKSGVVVVVSAGNSGYGTKKTQMTRNVRAGMLMTINDPGNAEAAITVGATHREKPHQYGPSYFSSKGPTGDGRFKPDLLAPGERIVSCGVGQKVADLGRSQDRDRIYFEQTGTSMAAPHVSGAIAAFLSVRREFIGRPERIKEIFTNAATDLGRDRYMQGAGMLDLMRAIQSI